MLFITTEYFVFLLIVLVAFYLSPQRFRRYILLAASYFFYASWNWKFLPVLLGLTAIDYFVAIWIAKTDRSYRKTALAIGLSANLGFLAIFKYYNFAAGNVAVLMGRPYDAFFVDIVLPLGISFHTFQSISYVVDVYRGNFAPVTDFIDYALFIAFFPQLVAGPIVRAHTFFADLFGWRPPGLAEIKSGCFLIILGLLKKLVLADNFSTVSDRYFAAVGAHPGYLAAWGGIGSFAMEIFFDFSGYTDMAIGSALLLGFHFPVNFRQPFLAISITDFWRRWHVSLSSWLRDYLYIPLGGNRHGKLNAYRNLIITMLLGGLWHGARWGFVTWGGFNGVLLALEKMSSLNRIRERPLKLLDIPSVIVTFALFCMGVVFVRANTMWDAFTTLAAMFSGPAGVWPVSSLLLILAAVSLLIALLEDRGHIEPIVQECPVWALGSCLGCLLFVVEVLGQHQTRPFYYFQF